ncbi:MAG: 50S ribosomal protein L10 [Anaerolineae bacterium]|nr:50S ribosomal protein L10 [Anaerolineae bacterium]
MAISRAKKEELVQQYVKKLSGSEAVIITDYRGLKVSDLQQLRAKIREVEGSFSIVKNTLAQRALTEAGLPVPEALLVGPVGIGFCGSNIPAVAKAIADFAKTNELLAVKGGLMGNKVIDEAAVQSLAKLPSLETLRAQLLGLINAPASQLVGVLSGSVRQVVNVIHAYSEQGSEAPAEA